MDPDEPTLVPVEAGYKHAIRARLALGWLPVIVAAVVLDRVLLAPAGFGTFLPLAFLALAILVVATAPARIYRRLRYRLTGHLLQVVRGWLFHVDTIVPLVRVQHLDVVRGPFDKLFGTATLVVHTAGTHNSTVSLPGLAPERAAEMRDVIREHVRTDFA